MRPSAVTRQTRLRACVISLLLVLPSAAQAPKLESLLITAEAAMESQNWEEALKLHRQATEEFSVGAALGPQFGVVHHRRGICEMKLKKWADAMQSFEICYRDFPNLASSEIRNPYEKLALLKWGEAAMGAQDWPLAVSRFQKFLEERDKERDVFPQGAFYVNLAICHYRMGELAEGSEHLEIAIHNKLNFPTPDSGIIAAFQELVRASITQRNERAILDFIAKNRGELVSAPFLMGRYSEAFMKLGGDALAVDMPLAAEAIYQLVPALDAMIDDTKARLRALGSADSLDDKGFSLVRAELEQNLASLEATKRGKNPPETVKLAATAYLHEARGNPHGAYAAYQQLELYDLNPENRTQTIYHLTRISSLIDLPDKTREYGMRLLRESPKFEKIAEVNQLVLAAVCKTGTPAESIAVAEPMLETLRQGTPEHDACLHLLGVSQFQDGDYEEARATLQRHQVAYPESSAAASRAFNLAAATSRLGEWREAAALLDGFLTDHTGPAAQALLPLALHERAVCYLSEGDANAALHLLGKIVEDFPGNTILGATYNLTGRAQQLAGEPAKAIAAYQKSLDFTKKQPDSTVAEEALAAMVTLSAVSKPSAQVIAYADRYWKEAGENSMHRKQVALAQMHAYQSAGRGEEALERLRELIAQAVRTPQAADAQELVAAYAVAYLNAHSAEELQVHFESLPEGSDEGNPGRAILRMEVISAFEKIAREATDEARKKTAAATVKSLFQEFINQFQVEELPSPLLLRLGDHLRRNTSIPREALACYDELLRRGDTEQRFPALLGRGDIHARATSDAEVAQSIGDFKQVYQESKNLDQQEYAIFRVIELSVAKRNFAEAAALAGTYLERSVSEFKTFIPQVNALLAACYQAQNLHDEAIAIYERLWKSHRDELDVSGPAMLQWMRLIHARNRKPGSGITRSDRQAAYALAKQYLIDTATVPSEREMPERAEIQQLADMYESQSGIPSESKPAE